MPGHCVAFMELARRVYEQPGLVTQTLREIAASRTRTSKVPNEVLASDVARAFKLMAAKPPSRAATEFAELLLALGPVDPQDKRGEPVGGGEVLDEVVLSECSGVGDTSTTLRISLGGFALKRCLLFIFLSTPPLQSSP